MSSALYKMHGAGNDFLLGVGSWADRLASQPDLAARLCHRRLGVGADGALAISATEGGDTLRLIYRNADGSEAAFCGNGTRCAARAGVELLGLPPRLVVDTAWARIPAEVDGATVRLELPPPPAEPREVEIDTADRCWHGRTLTVGVPHLVVPVADVDAVDPEVVGPALRRHAVLGPDGANIDFVASGADGVLCLRTFERGVEGETMCCGSGVVAAALVAMDPVAPGAITVRPRSGDELLVEAPNGPSSGPVFMTGPTCFIARVEPDEALAARK